MATKRKLVLDNLAGYIAKTPRSMNQWVSVFEDVDDENIFPQFDAHGDELFPDEIKEVCDYDLIHQRYEAAFLSWRRELWRNLTRVLDTYLDSGETRALAMQSGDEWEPKQPLDTGTICLKYMLLCKTQSFANTSREIFFPTFRKEVNVKRGGRKKSQLIEWGQTSKLEVADEIMHRETMKLKGWNTFHLADATPNYRNNGTFMHTHLAVPIVEDLLSLMGMSHLEPFIPGRIINAKLPFIASTPDICVARSESEFEQVYKELMNTGTINKKSNKHLPRMWGEVKTMQSPRSFVHKRDLHSLYQTIDDLHKLTGKTATVSGSLSNILCASDNSCEEMDNRRLNEHELTEKCKKLAVELLEDKLCAADWSRRSGDTLLKRTRLTSDKNPEYILNHKITFLFSEEHDPAVILPSDPLLQCGRGWVLVYDRVNDTDTCLASFSFDSAPFVLGPLNPFYIQIVEQSACVQYLNNNASFLFVLITKHEPVDVKSITCSNRPSLVYIYEVKIPEIVRSLYEKRCFHVAANFGFDTAIKLAGEKILFDIIDKSIHKPTCHSVNCEEKRGSEGANKPFHDMLGEKFG